MAAPETPTTATRGQLTPLRRVRDAWHLVREHRRLMGGGAWPHPLRPRSFNDWILHRLILDHDTVHRLLNDKVAMRGFVAARVGEAVLMPLLACVEDPADLPWDAFPPAVVVKPSHSSGLVIRIPDLARADRAAVEAEARSWLGRCYYEESREWGYRGIPRRILVEPMLPAAPGALNPYELKCTAIDGRIALFMARSIAPDGVPRWDAFDSEGRRLDLCYNGRAKFGAPAPPDAARARAAELCARLGAGLGGLRFDFYLPEDGRLLLGEITVYPNAGRGPYDPPAWDLWLGACWRAARAGRPWPPMPT